MLKFVQRVWTSGCVKYYRVFVFVCVCARAHTKRACAYRGRGGKRASAYNLGND